MYDMNDAGPQRDNEPMPDGTHVKATLVIRPGQFSLPGCDKIDEGLFRPSNSSDAVMLDCEFTVVEGPHIGRKWWQMFTVAGGKIDENNQSKGWLMTKPTIRAIIESATGLDPEDMSDHAKSMRMFQGFAQLSGIEFYVRIKIETGDVIPGTNPTRRYPNKNLIDRVLTVKDAEYAALRNGKDVPPHMRGAATTGSNSAAPAWSKPASAQAPVPKQGAPAWAAPTSAAPAQVAQPTQAGPSPAKGPAWLNA